MSKYKISLAVIKRLPKYHRCLGELKSRGVRRISSGELSKIIGFSASQIRQDLSRFGEFGQQGYGYRVNALYSEVEKILGLDKKYSTIIIGAGNIGQAIAKYNDFGNYGYELKAIFDIKKDLIGKDINGFKVMDSNNLREFIQKEDIDIAYICTNAENAIDVFNELSEAGIKGILNFARVDLQNDDNVVIENVHLVENMFKLSYFLKNKN